jgi:hypothetical protein
MAAFLLTDFLVFAAVTRHIYLFMHKWLPSNKTAIDINRFMHYKRLRPSKQIMGKYLKTVVVLFCAGRGLCDWLITRPEESYCVSNFV